MKESWQETWELDNWRLVQEGMSKAGEEGKVIVGNQTREEVSEEDGENIEMQRMYIWWGWLWLVRDGVVNGKEGRRESSQGGKIQKQGSGEFI